MDEPISPDHRLGVLAFGDSITNGGGELQWGVAMKSWAEWVARGLGLPFSNYAVDGNRAADVVHHQIPDFLSRTANPSASYELGCLYIGVNDVRALDWDPVSFDRDFRRALGFLHRRCERVLTVTAPLDLGRPRAGAKTEEANRLIEVAGREVAGRELASQEVAGRELAALVLDLRTFAARNLMMADHVHPTAFGQIAIAERALAVLAGDGMTIRAHPSRLIMYDTTWSRRLRSDATYAYRHTKVSAKALGSRLVARARGR